jgi:hypothetical protein
MTFLVPQLKKAEIPLIIGRVESELVIIKNDRGNFLFYCITWASSFPIDR